MCMYASPIYIFSLFILSFCSSVRHLSDKDLRVSLAGCHWVSAICARIVSQLLGPEFNNHLFHLRGHCRYIFLNTIVCVDFGGYSLIIDTSRPNINDLVCGDITIMTVRYRIK